MITSVSAPPLPPPSQHVDNWAAYMENESDPTDDSAFLTLPGHESRETTPTVRVATPTNVESSPGKSEEVAAAPKKTEAPPTQRETTPTPKKKPSRETTPTFLQRNTSSQEPGRSAISGEGGNWLYHGISKNTTGNCPYQRGVLFSVGNVWSL